MSEYQTHKKGRKGKDLASRNTNHVTGKVTENYRDGDTNTYHIKTNTSAPDADLSVIGDGGASRAADAIKARKKRNQEVLR